MLLQPGSHIPYLCFPTVGRSGNTSFSFCNEQPTAQTLTRRTRGLSLSGLYPSTNPAWLDLPGTTVPAVVALRVIETCKLHHHDKVPAQDGMFNIIKSYGRKLITNMLPMYHDIDVWYVLYGKLVTNVSANSWPTCWATR